MQNDTRHSHLLSIDASKETNQFLGGICARNAISTSSRIGPSAQRFGDSTEIDIDGVYLSICILMTNRYFDDADGYAEGKGEEEREVDDRWHRVARNLVVLLATRDSCA